MSPDRQGAARGERADAARNRQLILESARALFQSARTETITIDRIAAAAGVGKGTVFRRFGDYTGLVEALIADPVDELRTAIESGPPPLGPGAPASNALAAYLDALMDFVWANKPFIRVLEHRRAHAYYANAASQFWIAELRHRLAATYPQRDALYQALAIFGNLRPEMLDYLVNEQHMSRERIRQGLHELAGTA